MGKMRAAQMCFNSAVRFGRARRPSSRPATGSWEMGDGQRGRMSLRMDRRKQGAAERNCVRKPCPRQQRNCGLGDPTDWHRTVASSWGKSWLFLLASWCDQCTRCGDTLCRLSRIERLPARGLNTVELHTVNNFSHKHMQRFYHSAAGVRSLGEESDGSGRF
jgi:hypothetical protein